MDFKAFLKHIGRYKWLIIIVPLVTMGITTFMVKNLPKQYSSEAQISTGLVDQSKQLSAAEQNMDYFKTSTQFANIIEKMKMKKVMSILSYHLILHDLEDPKNSFKKYSEKLDSLTGVKKSAVIAAFKDKLLKKEILTLSDKGNNELYDYVASMGYDEKSISKNLSISRSDGSDYVTVAYVSANPALSAYLVNTLTTEFIENYTEDINFNQNNSLSLLDSLLKKKEAVMNAKNAALKNFKQANGVLNVDKQSEITSGQISANEDRKAQALRDIQANQGAISAIESKLRGRDAYTGGNTISDNSNIITAKNQLKVANDRYIDGGFKAADKRKVDSLSNVVSVLSLRSSDNNIVDPTASKQNLIQQRSALTIAMDQAKSSIASLDREHAQLKSKYNTMVPFDAGIQNFERDADLATKDYMDALNRYNQTRTEQNIGLKLNIAQVGLIGTPEPSKRVIYIALSFIASFFICFVAVVVLFFLDHTINNSKQLFNATKLPVIGNLSYVNNYNKSIPSIWNDSETPNYITYRNLLRSLRLEINNKMEESSSQILGITSLGNGEGKSFVASSLAHAFAMTGKKVLLIGGETARVESATTKELAVVSNFETFLIKREIHTEDLVTVLNKSNENSSLLEIQSSRNLKMGFEVLRREFELIIVDINSLQEINVAKEWFLFTEKNIAVFEVGKELSETDKDLLVYLKEQPGFMGWVLNKIKVTKGK
ncbi:Wzz/FepE/Etk N-terminal domain-containing protein [Pedobacter sp. L105]|uniref:GumC family protein n=1 Tax=Pedobacter sp. L105 TaxID=1641871 RepID=UPI00131B4DCD|nr:Wzz/FepE/Etk N-terminal domain-containing protein [Pedobacter sp. L105]